VAAWIQVATMPASLQTTPIAPRVVGATADFSLVSITTANTIRLGSVATATLPSGTRERGSTDGGGGAGRGVSRVPLLGRPWIHDLRGAQGDRRGGRDGRPLPGDRANGHRPPRRRRAQDRG